MMTSSEYEFTVPAYALGGFDHEHHKAVAKARMLGAYTNAPHPDVSDVELVEPIVVDPDGKTAHVVYRLVT